MPKSSIVRPILFDQYEALLRRLPPDHPSRKKIDSDYRRYTAGHYGEESVQYYFPLLAEHCTVLQQLRLRDTTSSHIFQIDLLIATPYFLYIGEIKQMSGSLYFYPEQGQLIQDTNGEKRAFACPLSQSVRQAAFLKHKLAELGIKDMPMEAHVISSNAAARLIVPENVANIYHSSRLPTIIDVLFQKYSRKKVSQNALTNVLMRLKQESMEKQEDLLKRYGIDELELFYPIACKTCEGALKRSYGTWVCCDCGEAQPDRHIEALQDLRILLKTPVTMRVFLTLLRKPSYQVGRRLMLPFLERKGQLYVFKRYD
ncbi:nuclease-related domain-containing protein [Bacillus daqingensis]|uniref:Nuclease-related domain-containing protein n=1 Tax=Bacillus daqingensis TaxID=872396 RepID=A0ABV9NY52_9BACI